MLYNYILYIYTLLHLSRKSGRLIWVRLQQPQEQRYPVLQVHAGSFRFSVFHRTLTMVMDYIIFNVRKSLSDHSFASVHTPGGWAYRQRELQSAQHFLL